MATYPTTNLGLLTVDIPAGKHVVDIAWRGTPLQFWSALLSQLTLVLLCLFLLWWRSGRWWLVVLLPLLTFGLAASYVQPQLVPVQAVKLDASPQGLEFLGYMPPKLDLDAQGVQLSTYWLATETQPTPLLTRWRMVAASGEVVQEVTATPFYNGYSSHDWASNTLVDDGYWLPLPPALAAGTYQIQMTVLDEQSGKSYASFEIGAVTLKQPTKPVAPTHPLAVRLGENVQLSGYDFKLIAPTLQRQTVAKRPEIPVVYPGQTLEYTLYWQTHQAMNTPYVGFMHLVDHAKVAAVQQDQSPGPLLQPAALWTPYGLYPDRYLLPIQQGMASGLYTPMIGMYNKGDAHRLDVTVPGVEGVFDHYELPSVKVINPNVRPIGTKVSARFGEFAELTRFHIEGDGAKGGTAIALGRVEDELPIQPGDRLTLTTYYKVQAPSPTALTRFVQVRNLQNQVFAQYDSEPQEGGNPSWAWVRGEIIADAVSITLPTNTPADQYTLYLGWYDAAANLTRVPTVDRQNVRLVNDEYPLLKLNVTQ